MQKWHANALMNCICDLVHIIHVIISTMAFMHMYVTYMYYFHTSHRWLAMLSVQRSAVVVGGL